MDTVKKGGQSRARKMKLQEASEQVKRYRSVQKEHDKEELGEHVDDVDRAAEVIAVHELVRRLVEDRLQEVEVDQPDEAHQDAVLEAQRTRHHLVVDARQLDVHLHEFARADLLLTCSCSCGPSRSTESTPTRTSAPG